MLFKPCVIWMTGLPAAGKTTLARALVAQIERASPSAKVEHLDGDSLRDLFPQTGFSPAERDMHIRRVGHLASLLEKHGVIVVASFISPYDAARKFVRSVCTDFQLVHVATPLEVCADRDPKGLYARARRGELADFTGVSAPYEPPDDAELVIAQCGGPPDTLSTCIATPGSASYVIRCVSDVNAIALQVLERCLTGDDWAI